MNGIQEIKVDFEPAIINIAEREQFEQYVNEVVTKYKNYTVSAETLKDDRATRALLNKLVKQIDDKRKEVKREFNKPIDEFTAWVKKASEPLNKTVASIDKSIKELEEHEKQIRSEIIRAEIQNLTKESGIDHRIFEGMVAEWSKAANFNKDFKPKKTLQDSMSYAVDQERLKQEEIKKNKKNISNFAFMSGISDTPYIRMYDDGKEVSEILEIMNEDIAKEKARKEAEEAQRKVEEQKRQELVNQQLQKDFNGQDEQPQVQEEKLSERVLPEEVETPSKSEKLKKRYRATIEIEFESLEDKDQWKRCMMANGFGEFKAIDFKEIK
ncbi:MULTISPECIES: DUF1351 domain-containing protein [Lactococcus]|uniref:DUF1351 domain-containing protein n=1 Tax=Lactococcus TaxID=1357 RepID=UPI001E41D44A|nr:MULTISPECIES: DUF1351 domain-containing protein [Lactococcus]USI71048.1 DUF1351 domain-containing protein [Lactococcus garvieae subsp. garvieae]